MDTGFLNETSKPTQFSSNHFLGIQIRTLQLQGLKGLKVTFILGNNDLSQISKIFAFTDGFAHKRIPLRILTQFNHEIGQIG